MQLTYQPPKSKNYAAITQDIVIQSPRIVTELDSTYAVKIDGEGARIFQPLGVASLSVLVFYSVSGGPFGIEGAVQAGGFFFALLGVLVFPLVWSVPEALMTAELGSAFPEASGGVAWVEEAFGKKAGFIAGYNSWISGATDNAIYPVLFLEYLLQHIFGNDDAFEGMNRLLRFLLLSSTSVILAYLNYLGLEIVGNMSIIICIVSISPFVVMCIIGIPKVDPSRWIQFPDEDSSVNGDEMEASGWLPVLTTWGVLWRPLLNNLFWNLNSFDSAANFAGEARDPGRTFPRGMFYSVILVAVAYFVPLLIAIGATDSPQSEWVDGYLAVVAAEIGGRWLGTWTVFASGISNLALFQAEMSSDAFGIMGMAERGMLPKIFATKSRHGTPTYGILLGAFVIVVMSVADFSDLVEMLNFTYSISLLMEYAAFIKLRISKGDVIRPYRVPLNTFGCVALILPPCMLTIFVMMLASFMTYVYFAVSILLGMCLYVAHTRCSGYSFGHGGSAKKRFKFALVRRANNDSHFADPEVSIDQIMVV